MTSSQGTSKMGCSSVMRLWSELLEEMKKDAMNHRGRDLADVSDSDTWDSDPLDISLIESDDSSSDSFVTAGTPPPSTPPPYTQTNPKGAGGGEVPPPDPPPPAEIPPCFVLNKCILMSYLNLRNFICIADHKQSCGLPTSALISIYFSN